MSGKQILWIGLIVILFIAMPHTMTQLLDKIVHSLSVLFNGLGS